MYLTDLLHRARLQACVLLVRQLPLVIVKQSAIAKHDSFDELMTSRPGRPCLVGTFNCRQPSLAGRAEIMAPSPLLRVLPCAVVERQRGGSGAV
jgi:hypothetical protein